MIKNKILTEMLQNAGVDPGKILGEDVPDESDGDLNEGVYYRASSKGVENLLLAMREIKSIHKQISAGNDLNMKNLDQVISMLNDAKKTAEKSKS